MSCSLQIDFGQRFLAKGETRSEALAGVLQGCTPGKYLLMNAVNQGAIKGEDEGICGASILFVHCNTKLVCDL